MTDNTPPSPTDPAEPPQAPLSGRGWIVVLTSIAAVLVVLAGGGYLLNRALADDASVAGSAAPGAGPTRPYSSTSTAPRWRPATSSHSAPGARSIPVSRVYG